jgi:ABC-type phosphate/phosphonate transport system substrate-binding protein
VGKKDTYSMCYYEYSKISKIVTQTYAWENNIEFYYKKLPKESKLILEVFFNKCDMTIVKESTWDLMTELNPQINSNISVVYKTKRIFADIITLFSKNLDEKSKNIYIKAIEAIDNTPDGKQLMELFKFNGLVHIKNSEINPLKEFYQKYLLLKKEKND